MSEYRSLELGDGAWEVLEWLSNSVDRIAAIHKYPRWLRRAWLCALPVSAPLWFVFILVGMATTALWFVTMLLGIGALGVRNTILGGLNALKAFWNLP